MQFSFKKLSGKTLALLTSFKCLHSHLNISAKQNKSILTTYRCGDWDSGIRRGEGVGIFQYYQISKRKQSNYHLGRVPVELCVQVQGECPCETKQRRRSQKGCRKKWKPQNHRSASWKGSLHPRRSAFRTRHYHLYQDQIILGQKHRNQKLPQSQCLAQGPFLSIRLNYWRDKTLIWIEEGKKS